MAVYQAERLGRASPTPDPLHCENTGGFAPCPHESCRIEAETFLMSRKDSRTPQQSTELPKAITFLTIVKLFINIAKKYEENINVMESGLMFFFFILLLNISSSSKCYIIKLLLLILLLLICYALIL